jgi:hypothetical protein
MPSPFYTWRSGRAYPGNRVYFWSPTGQLPPFATVDGSNYVSIDSGLSLPAFPDSTFPTRQGNDPNNYVMSVDVSSTAMAGTYTLTFKDGVDHTTVRTLTIIVADRPTATAANVALADGRAGIQTAIDGGHSPIILAPGDYEIDEFLTLNTGTPAAVVEIDGRGMASFTRLPQSGAYYNQFFSVTNSLTLRGITFRGSQAVPFQPDNVLVSYPYDPSSFDINVVGCRFEDCSLGEYYALPDPDTDAGGTLVENCEFIRSTISYVLTGMVVNQCVFRDSSPAGVIPLVVATVDKWLVLNTDFVRTPRGIYISSDADGTVQNGVVAACRFYDIAFGDGTGAGEAILFEKYDGGDNFIQNNAFVWCHLYRCNSSAPQLAGGGINYNFFKFIDSDAAGIGIYPQTDIVGNVFQNMEVSGIDVRAAPGYDGHTSNNLFNWIVIRQLPLAAGMAEPGLITSYGYNDPDHNTGLNRYVATPPVVDTTTPSGTNPANQYLDNFLCYPDRLEHVFQFPTVPFSENTQT